MISTIVSIASALFYISNISIFSLLSFIAYKPSMLLDSSVNNRGVLILLEIASSFLSDLPLHHITIEVICILLTYVTGGFVYSTTCVVLLLIQIPIFISQLGLFISNASEIHQVRETVEEYIQDGSINREVHSIFSFFGITLLLNPFWTPKEIIQHSDIPYCTDEEYESIADTHGEAQAAKLKLNVVISSNRSDGLHPVVIHFHGGSWVKGSKEDVFYPYQKGLIVKENWVIVNAGYRLAPDNAYPILFIDVKRVIRWVKQNIKNFGGNPEFILLAGDSSGGHLASMAALTINQSEYQPGFEQEDTSVQGVISLNGVLDVERDERRREYFSKVICQKPVIDDDFMSRHSPISLLPGNERAKNKKLSFLIITGGKDAIVNVDQGKRFKHICDTKDMNCTLLVLPGGHHGHYVCWSPRSYYTSQLITLWCKQLYSY